MDENLDKQITENVPEFFFIWDLATQKMIYMTHGHESFASVELQEQSIYGMMLDFVHPEHRKKFEEILHGFAADNAYQDHDLKVNDEKYSAQWLNLRSFPIENKRGEVYRIVAHISDVTQRKEQLNALEKLNEKNESIIRIMAHDLRNPLGNMIMLTELAENEIKHGDPQKSYSFLKMIREAGKNTHQMIDSMLELLELNGSQLPLDLKRINLNVLTENLLQSFTYSCKAYDLQLERQLPEKPVHVTLDAQKFCHVINNLLSNALKFTPRGGKITVQVEETEEHVVLSVRDTGIGIAQDKQEEIFNEFSKARQRGLHGEKSIGLGLSIAKKIVELHLGSIQVESCKGQGTTFTICMPKYETSNSA